MGNREKVVQIVSSGLILKIDIWRVQRTVVMNFFFLRWNMPRRQFEAVVLICFNKIVLDWHSQDKIKPGWRWNAEYEDEPLLRDQVLLTFNISTTIEGFHRTCSLWPSINGFWTMIAVTLLHLLDHRVPKLCKGACIRKTHFYSLPILSEIKGLTLAIIN